MKIFVLSAFLFTVMVLLPAQQPQWKWPDQPKNITALPATIGGRDLQRTMFGFTSALGVRCTYCHVGEEGKDFSEFDFVSDAKPAKNTARVMISMVKNINTKYLSVLHDDTAPSLQVNCQTCHRGNSSPILLEEQLKKTFDRSGIDSTVKQYRALREQLYGGFTYNFKEGTLLRLADRIAEDSTKISAAVDVVKLNIELYPSFAQSFAQIGGYYERLGNKKEALAHLQKALSMNPQNEMLKRRIERLQSGK